MPYKLSISDLRVMAHIGCSSNERSVLQPIGIDVDVNFHTSPKGVFSDRLEDTICYFTLCESIKVACKNQQFHLIEHFAQFVYNHIVQSVQHKNIISAIEVRVRKILPPIEDLHGSVSFTILREVK